MSSASGMKPSVSGPAYSAPGNLTLQLGVTRQNESHRRERHVSATRLDSRTTCSTPACLRYQLVASPAWPAPMIATSTDSAISGANRSSELSSEPVGDQRRPGGPEAR